MEHSKFTLLQASTMQFWRGGGGGVAREQKLAALLESWQISRYVTDDAITQSSTVCDVKFSQIEGNV